MRNVIMALLLTVCLLLSSCSGLTQKQNDDNLKADVQDAFPEMRNTVPSSEPVSSSPVCPVEDYINNINITHSYENDNAGKLLEGKVTDLGSTWTLPGGRLETITCRLGNQTGENMNYAYCIRKGKIISSDGTVGSDLEQELVYEISFRNYVWEVVYKFHLIDNNCIRGEPYIPPSSHLTGTRENKTTEIINVEEGLANCAAESRQHFRDFCYEMLGRKLKDLNICDKIIDQAIKNRCYMDIAKSLQDTNICYQLREDIQSNCIDYVKMYNP